MHLPNIKHITNAKGFLQTTSYRTKLATIMRIRDLDFLFNMNPSLSSPKLVKRLVEGHLGGLRTNKKQPNSLPPLLLLEYIILSGAFSYCGEVLFTGEAE